MKRYIKSTVAALLTVVIILSTYIPVVAEDQPSSYSSKYNSGERDVVCTTLSGTSADDYYSGSYEYDVLSALSSSQILSSLRTLMTSTHYNNSSYSDCRDMADQTDCENEDGRVLLIYTSYSATTSQWNGWNREHIWPQSLGGYSTSGAGSDLHHIRPSDASVNSSRGNKRYGEVSNGNTVTGNNPASGYVGGTSNSSFFEPNDNVKGDVARICLYMYVRYGGESQYTCGSITTVFQSVDVLLDWCELDPVDTWEMGRNEVVEAYQGNRNVFIDYPEYAWLIFGREIPSDMVTPSGEAAKGNNSGNNGSGGGDDPVVPSVCTHQNTDIKGVVQADCYNDGYTGDIYCIDCDNLISYGSQIPVTNAHSFGDWELDENDEFVKHCSICGATAYLSIDVLLGSIDNDAEKILILLTLGITDAALLDALYLS